MLRFTKIFIMNQFSTVQEVPVIYYREFAKIFSTNDTIITEVIPPGRPYPIEITTITLVEPKPKKEGAMPENKGLKKLIPSQEKKYELSIGIDVEQFITHFYVFKEPVPYHVLSGVKSIYTKPILLSIHGGKIRESAGIKHYKNELQHELPSKGTGCVDVVNLLHIITGVIKTINMRFKLPEPSTLSGQLLPVSSFKRR